MKTQYKFLSLLFLCLGITISSCSSDNDDNAKNTSNTIGLEQNEVKIKLQDTPENPIEGEENNEESNDEYINSASIKVLSGNGDYSAFSLNDKIVTAQYDAESNSVIIEGKSVGSVRIMVIDGQVESAAITALVFKHPRIALEDDIASLDLTIYNNNPQTTSYKIVEGNGNYKISVDKRGVVDAELNRNGELSITPINAEDEESRTAIVTITDECKFVLNIEVKVQNSFKPYSTEELEAILKIDIPTVLFAGNKANNNYDYVNKKEGELTVFGAVREDDYSDGSLLGLRLYVPGEIKKGAIKGVQIDYDEFGDWDTSSGKKNVMYFEIIDINEKYIVAVFSALKGNYRGTLQSGYFVLERTEDQLPAQEEI